MIRFCLIVLMCLMTAFPVFAENNVIEQVYQNLARDYLHPTEPKTIMLKGLKALETLDPQIKVSATNDKVYLYYRRKVSKTFRLPQPNAKEEAWVSLTQEVIDQAVRVSPKAELLDFEIPDRFAESVFKNLDGYSHYYGTFVNEQTPQTTVRRNYAVRMIDDVMMIKILTFHQGVAQKVATAVADCSACRGIILDLRGNHGGILEEAVQIADLFLDEGIITYTSEKDDASPKYYMASAGDKAARKPLVVLIDGMTASAAEVLSAALSEQNRAVLIGTQSFGKGTIQDVFKLGDQRAMALTSAYFYTPSGHKIDKNGVMPALCTGGLTDTFSVDAGSCRPEDRLTQEIDVETAVKYIKNEL